MSGWIGVDLDGTLAYYDHWRGEDHIGDPIPGMVRVVKRLLAKGNEVRIFTARASLYGRDADRRQKNVALIKAWCKEHLGEELEVTSDKDFNMVALYDDRAYRVVLNEGFLVEDELIHQLRKLRAEANDLWHQTHPESMGR